MNSSQVRTTQSGGMSVFALLALQLGVIAVVLATTPFKPFELDRFFVPKELAMHASVLVCVLFCVARVRTLSFDRVDSFLLCFGALSLVSALLASNHWLSLRSVAITFSSLAAFWSARALSSSGFRRPLMGAVILATVLGAATSLAQAYGWESDYLTLSRAPGGTFGNRNFVAHLSAIAVPLLIWYATTARRIIVVILCALGGAILAAALVMSRSRAAWLALLVVALLLALPVWRAARRVQHADATRRLIFLAVVAAVGVVLSLVLPNRLNWKSDSPYLDSVRGVVDYNSGSGRGRLIQYRNTLHMAEAHPILGVGPGNWPVIYPRFASSNDPSLSHEDDTTANPWPSSDWVALIAERGVVAMIALILAVIGIIANAFQTSRGSSANNPAARDPFLPVAIAATVLITAAVGSFDAVMLLAAPALIIWTSLGALAAGGRARSEWTPSATSRAAWKLATVVPLALFAVRSLGQVFAMQVFGAGQQLSHVETAALLDPGNYRIQLRLAVLGVNARGCSLGLPHAKRAAAMLPSATAPRVIVRRCGR